MTIGPVQFIAVDFDSIDHLEGRVIEELDRLAPSGAVRILDVLFVAKDETGGDLVALELSDLAEEEEAGLGLILGELLGFSFEGEGEDDASTPDADASAIGIGPTDIQRIGDELAPGSASMLLLIEHRWASGLRDAMTESGGHLRAHGFLTQEGMLTVGAELVATASALDAIETAVVLEAEATVRSLEALATIELAAETEAAVVAHTVLTLVAAGIIEEAAAEEAAAAVLGAAVVEEAAAKS
jgi:hypothetical protein